MEAFGDHLGADEDVGFAGAELSEKAIVGPFVAGGVSIHTKGSDFGEDGVEGAFDLLGAGAFELEGGRSVAVRACFGRRFFCVAAGVAVEGVDVFVIGQRDVTVGAFLCFAARCAADAGVVAASV